MLLVTYLIYVIGMKIQLKNKVLISFSASKNRMCYSRLVFSKSSVSVVVLDTERGNVDFLRIEN